MKFIIQKAKGDKYMHYFIDSKVDVTIITYFSSYSESVIEIFLEENQMFFSDDFNLVKEYYKGSGSNKLIRLKDLLFKFKETSPEKYDIMLKEMVISLYGTDFWDRERKKEIMRLFKDRGLNFDKEGNLIYSDTNNEFKGKEIIAISLKRYESVDRNLAIYQNLLDKIKDYRDLDDVLSTYVKESCSVATMGQMLSAMTTLGAASERLFKLFVDSYVEFKEANGAAQAEKDKLLSYTKGISTAEKMKDLKNKVLSDAVFEENILKEYLSKKKSQSDKNTEIENIFAVFNIIRVGRNEAAHPTGEVLTPEQFSAKCSMFYDQLDNILNIIDLIGDYVVDKLLGW